MHNTAEAAVEWFRPRRVALFATAAGVIVATQMYAIGALRQRVVGTPGLVLASVLTTHLAFWLLWAASVPIVLAVARRLERSRLPTAGRFVVHLAVGGTLGFANAAAVYGLKLMLGLLDRPTSWLADYLGFASWQFSGDVLAYGAILAVYHVSHSQRLARDSDVSAARLRGELAMTRLAALRSQVHPHFLFNTLNSISALVDENPAEARRAIELLGELLRLSLSRGDADLIPLRDELQFAELYLAIQQIRYGARLRVERAVDDGSMDCLVPSFVLLPLVENAVKHGVARHRGPGRVELSVHHHDRAITLMVANNGSWQSRPGLPGTGLARLRERLNGLFGAGARLELETGSGDVRVCVRVPSQPLRAAAP